jgi:hypothetical protein
MSDGFKHSFKETGSANNGSHIPFFLQLRTSTELRKASEVESDPFSVPSTWMSLYLLLLCQIVSILVYIHMFYTLLFMPLCDERTNLRTSL